MKRIFILLLIISLFGACSGNKKNKKVSSTEVNSIEQEYSSIHQQEYDKHKNGNMFDDTSMLVEAVDIQNITEDLSERFIAPVFSSDGNKIIFTTENYIGIWVYDIKQNTIQQLNSLPGSGYNFSLSKDGSKVYFRNKTQKAKRHGGKYSIFEQDILTKKINVILTTEKIITTPIVLNNSLLFLEDNELKEIPINTKNSLGGKAIPSVYFVIDNKLMKYKIGEDAEKISLNNMKIVSVKYTRDNKNLVCLTTNNGLLLLDLNGYVVNNYKEAHFLTKLFNSSLVVIVEEDDDGSKITKSQMYMGFISSNKKRKIFNLKDEKVFTPSWSLTENKIVYSTDKGNIKIVKLNIKRKEAK